MGKKIIIGSRMKLLFPSKQAFAFSAALLILTGVAVLAVSLNTETAIVADTVKTGTINATSLSVNEISGHKVAGQLDMAGNRIVNVANPVGCQDAATKNYVDGVLSGTIKPTCG